MKRASKRERKERERAASDRMEALAALIGAAQRALGASSVETAIVCAGVVGACAAEMPSDERVDSLMRMAQSHSRVSCNAARALKKAGAL